MKDKYEPRIQETFPKEKLDTDRNLTLRMLSPREVALKLRVLVDGFDKSSRMRLVVWMCNKAIIMVMARDGVVYAVIEKNSRDAVELPWRG